MKNLFFLPVIASCLLLCGCPQTQQRNTQNEIDYERCWSAVGSAGTLDGSFERFLLGTTPRFFIPPDQDPLPFNVLNLSHDGVVSVRANETTNLSIRYNVGYLMEKKPYGKILKVRYLVKDKNKQRVIVTLKKYNLDAPPATENAEVVKIFDSKSFDSSPNFQTRSVNITGDEFNGVFDFMNYAYFIEVLLIKIKAEEQQPIPLLTHTAPAVGSISICDPPIVVD